MAKQYTVLFIDDKGTPVRESRVSRRSIRFVSVLVIIFLSIVATGTHRYINMQQALADKDELLAQIGQQNSALENQRHQIQSFAKEINSLKVSLKALNDFETKIRIIANLEHKADQASLFSVGGSIPDDLDTNLPLNQDHDRLVREMHHHMDTVQHVSSLQENSFESLLKSLEGKRNLLAATPSLRPTTGWISSKFGYRVSPFTNRKEFHKGLDIATRKGTPIIAPADGIVTYSGKKWLIGNMLTIDHGYGMVTRYGHIYKFKKNKGDRVTRGEVIALVGNTGRSTGPHLHYEVRLNGVPVNPSKYILD
ncbi:MAG: peptidoglycan DD-metalloendopeptidase family protein [Desulfobacteraceae bacterium]|jgi:murein DD-endopeptidase MepM/ murein hydrolase activator NlpD